MSAAGPIDRKIDRQCAAARPWKFAPAHWVLASAHAGGLAAAMAQPTLWPWALSTIGASHALAAAFAFDATSGFLGPVISRLPANSAARGELALTFDDGPDPEVTPRVLDLLDAKRAYATFFCVSKLVAKHAALAREIVRRGHAVENHSAEHSPTLPFRGVRGLMRDIGDAQQSIADVTGAVPRFFRPPFGVRTPLTEPALARLGMHCVGWSVRSYDTVDTDGERVARRVIARMCPGSIVLLHDRGRVRVTPSVLGALPRVLEAIAAGGGRPVTLRQALA